MPYAHLPALGVNINTAKKLEALARWPVRFQILWYTTEYLPGSKGVVQGQWGEGAGMQRATDEFPERSEVLKLCIVGIIVI